MSSDLFVKKVSVIVNTYNRAPYLKVLLESFLHLDYKDFEVIVVNGPSVDGTAELLSEWESFIKIGNCLEANLSMSRNIGIAMAAGEFIAFIDDDAVPEPEWLNQAIDAFESEEIAGVGGPVFDNSGYSFQCKYVHATRLGNGTWGIDHPSPHNCFPFSFEFPYLSGGNVLFRRNMLLEIGGFDEEYQYYLDETDVCLRLIDAGYILKQLSNSYIHHKYAPSHIREHNISKYRYTILKSKVYFSNRHGRKYLTQEEIDSDNNVFIDNNRKEIVEAVSAEIFAETDLQEFEEHARDALIQGERAAEMPQKLITQELLQVNSSSFKQFQAIRCGGTAVTIAFLCENNVSDSGAEVRCIARDKAKELAAMGFKVHVIVHGSNYNTVDFEQGVWVHRILPYEKVKSDDADGLSIPQESWNLSQSFLDELDRISQYRDIDIVQAPVKNMVGSAVLLSERYCVISSFSANDVGPNGLDLSAENEGVHDVDKVLDFYKLYIIKNSHGVLADNINTAKAIETIFETENVHDKILSCTQGESDLRRSYTKILKIKCVNKREESRV